MEKAKVENSRAAVCMQFEVMNKDAVIARVRYVYASKCLEIVSCGEHFMDKNILKGVLSMEDLCDWFETRCFLRSRSDADFHLKALGLSEYSPYNIARKTNGALFEDTYWIRWADQDYLAWADVDPRNPGWKLPGTR